jgi:hypothetical protein
MQARGEFGSVAGRKADASGAAPRELLVLLAVLVPLLCICYANVVFGGRSLVYTDARNPFDARFMPENYGPGFVPESVWSSRNLLTFANFHDPGGVWWQWEPAGEFLRRGLRRGEFPLWDPYVAAGAPALANLASTAFFPPYLAIVLLGGGALLKNLYFLSMLLVAAVSAYYFLRRHGLAVEACLGSAIAVTLCGGLSQNVGSFIGQTAALIPLSLLLTRWFLESPTWRRSAALATAYAGIALSTVPPVLVASFGLSGVYAAVFIVRGYDRLRSAVRYSAALGVSLLLVCFVYLPAVAASHTPQVEKIYAGAGLETLGWSAFGQLLSPVLAGGRKVLRDSPVLGPDRALPYVGVAVLLLASLARARRRRDATLLLGLLTGAALFISLKLMGVWPAQAIGYLPVFDRIHFSHYLGIPLDIVLCLLAGFGLDALLAGEAPRRRLALSFGVLAAVAGCLLAYFLRLGKAAHPFAGQWLHRWDLLAGILIAATLLVWFAGRAGPGTPGRRRMIYGLLALLALEGVGNAYYPRPRRWNVWRHPVPYVQELIRHRELGRVFASGAFSANGASAFEVYGLDSLMTFNSPRVFDLYRRYAAPEAYLFLRDANQLPPDPVLDAANIALLAIYELRTNQTAEARARGYQSLWHDGNVEIFSRASSPRYFFTSQYRVVPPEQALEELAQARAPREILVEGEPGFPSLANADSDPAVAARVERNRVTLRFDAPRPGLVYCSEADAAGWRALVNGRPVPILRANYGFRAIPVPAGKLTIELAYWPPGLTPGLLALSCGLLGIVIMAARRETAAESSLTLRPPLHEAWRRRATWATILVVMPLLTVETCRRYDLTTLEKSWGKPEDPLRPRADAFYRVAWGRVEVPSVWRAGETVVLRVPLRNLAGEAWPAPTASNASDPVAAGAVRLSYRWLSVPDGEPLAPYALRVDLSRELPPGQETTLTIPVSLPNTPGDYRLQFDLVHELVSWFETKGAAPLIVPVKVEARDLPAAAETQGSKRREMARSPATPPVQMPRR